MLKYNHEQLVMMSVVGEISSPSFRGQYRVSPDGEPQLLPGVGGISYNVRVGDRVCGWKADHVEPCVSSKNSNNDSNGAYNLLACIGNEATLVSGQAKGAKGVVTGKHGGIEHVLIDFDDKTVDKLVIGDKIQIKAVGLGMELTDFPGVKVMNVGPELLRALPLKAAPRRKGVLRVPVTHLIPASIMGSGLGASMCERGDYDIQLFDEKIVKQCGLDTLRFGDLVAIVDADHTFGRIYRTGAVSIGVVVHSMCTTAGHGPGVTTLFTSREGLLDPELKSDANIGRYLGIGRWRRATRGRSRG